MGTTVADVIAILDRMAPPGLAEAWDNVGLQVGFPRREVTSVWVALDAAPNVIRAACEAGVSLLVTHHPLIFKPLKRIDGSSPPGAALMEAVAHGLAVYAMHTNFDAVAGGLNDVLARRIGLKRVEPLGSETEANRIGRIGRLVHESSVHDLALAVKHRLGIPGVRAVGVTETRVRRAAIVTGSGAGLLPLFIESPAEVLITGDLRYHDARDIEAAGRAAIDIGHFHSEHLMAREVAGRLQRRLNQRRPPVRVTACAIEKDPFHYI